MILKKYKLNELQVKAVSDCVDEVCRICDYRKKCNNISGCSLFSILNFASMTKVEPFADEKNIEENNKTKSASIRPLENPFL